MRMIGTLVAIAIGVGIVIWSEPQRP